MRGVTYRPIDQSRPDTVSPSRDIADARRETRDARAGRHFGTPHALGDPPFARPFRESIPRSFPHSTSRRITRAHTMLASRHAAIARPCATARRAPRASTAREVGARAGAERELWYPGAKAPKYLDGTMAGDYGAYGASRRAR